MNIKEGDVLSAHHIRVNAGIMHLDFCAGTCHRFVFIYLGIEPRNGSKPLDPIERMEKLGWVKKDERGK
jgi:hypothetical protein